MDTKNMRKIGKVMGRRSSTGEFYSTILTLPFRYDLICGLTASELYFDVYLDEDNSVVYVPVKDKE